jgi:hypothetical protein
MAQDNMEPRENNQERRVKQSKEVDWSGNIYELSPELKTSEGINAIITRIDAFGGKGPKRTLRINCVINQLQRLEFKPTSLQTLISLIKTSGTYNFHESCNEKGKEDMIKWDIATLCCDGKAGKLLKKNESLV